MPLVCFVFFGFRDYSIIYMPITLSSNINWKIATSIISDLSPIRTKQNSDHTCISSATWILTDGHGRLIFQSKYFQIKINLKLKQWVCTRKAKIFEGTSIEFSCQKKKSVAGVYYCRQSHDPLSVIVDKTAITQCVSIASINLMSIKSLINHFNNRRILFSWSVSGNFVRKVSQYTDSFSWQVSNSFSEISSPKHD